jgi:hypothetical protein
VCTRILHKLSSGLLILVLFKWGLLVAQTTSPTDKPDSTQQRLKASDSLRVAVKSPKGAMLRSLCVPGWGQLYNGKWFKALLAAGTEFGLIANAVVQNQYAVKSQTELEKEFYQDNRRLSLWWLGAALLYSITDAYVDAQLYHFDESPSLSLYQNKGSTGLMIRIVF